MSRTTAQPKTVDTRTERPPVITIMGHIDHGKSTLLDYIRKTNIVASETGGITQRLSAYEVIHSVKDPADKTGEIKTNRRITFLDTPGHEAFTKMRYRGSGVADIAILVVSAEDGVKPQTKEALECIQEYKLPYIVAITKIDKGSADIERTKQNLLENNIFLEGLGGDVPYVPISSKTGEGVDELLDMMLLVADLAELTGDASKDAEGTVIEAHRDPKRGISATLIIKNGVLKSGMYVVSGDSISPVRIMEDFKGEQIGQAQFSSPVQITGWTALPEVGAPFKSFPTKKEAEQATAPRERKTAAILKTEEEEHAIPVVIKADTQGSLDAIDHELAKLANDRVVLRIVQRGVGAVSENDIKSVSGNSDAIVVGFNVAVDTAAAELARKLGIPIQTFDIIYTLAEWLEDTMAKRTPQMEVEEKHGTAKILKTFSKTKNKQVVGGKVKEGAIRVGDRIRIQRGEETPPAGGEGKILTLQQQKVEVQEVREGSQFGAQITVEETVKEGDELISFATRVI